MGIALMASTYNGVMLKHRYKAYDVET
jgi:hypothetical protein